MIITEQFSALDCHFLRAIDGLPKHASSLAMQVRLEGTKGLCERGIALTQSHCHDPVR